MFFFICARIFFLRVVKYPFHAPMKDSYTKWAFKRQRDSELQIGNNHGNDEQWINLLCFGLQASFPDGGSKGVGVVKGSS